MSERKTCPSALFRIEIRHVTVVVAEDASKALLIARRNLDDIMSEEAPYTHFDVEPIEMESKLPEGWADGSIPWGSSSDLPATRYFQRQRP